MHERVETYGARIDILEKEIATFQARTSPDEPHPLLKSDLLRIKYAVDVVAGPPRPPSPTPLPPDIVDALGTLTLTPSGAEVYVGKSAGTEVHVLAHPSCLLVLLTVPRP